MKPCTQQPHHNSVSAWILVRQDDNGNTYVVASYATEADARHAAKVFEDRGHKQMYSVVRASQLDMHRASRS